MIKRAIVPILAVLTLAAAGCGAQDNTPDTQTEDAPAAEIADEAQPPAEDTEEIESAEADTQDAGPADEDSAAAMTVTSSGIIDGIIDPKYGKNGDMVEDGVPTLSLPLSIENAPEGTVCYAIYMDDPDAVPIAGYNWVHWTAVNIVPANIPENFSAEAGSNAVQGTNDFGTIGYGGPAPPDKDHTYVIAVFALNDMIALEDGFAKEDFDAAIQPHVLATFVFDAVYVK